MRERPDQRHDRLGLQERGELGPQFGAAAAGLIGRQATSIPILTEGGVSWVCRPPYPGWNMTVCVRLIRAGTWPPSEVCRQRSVITGPGAAVPRSADASSGSAS